MQPTPTPIASAATRNLGAPPADPLETRRVERVIAVARLFNSVAIVETAVAQIDAFRLGSLPLTLVLSYAAISLLALIVLAWRRAMPPRLPILMQLVDIGVAATIPWSHGMRGLHPVPDVSLVGAASGNAFVSC